MIPDNCILQARAVVSAVELTHGEEKHIMHVVDHQLRQALAEELSKVGSRWQEQTPDGLVVRHEVLVFDRVTFYRIVREEAQRLFQRSLTYIPPPR